MFSTLTCLSAVLMSASFVSAQTYTLCNPLNSTCPNNAALNAKSFSTDFTKGAGTSWTMTGPGVTYSNAGAAFTITQKGQAPTIETNFYIFFGYVEVTMRIAPGTGIVSAIVLQSEDLDEIDFEWLGTAPTNVQTNFFGKGDTTTYNRMVPVSLASSAITTTRTYGLNWTSTSLQWLIDGAVVRTLLYGDSMALGGKTYPQTPCKLKLGNWAGGASENAGTVAWAGGKTDFSQSPFTMYVESVRVTNYNPGTSYVWSDRSGDWRSIKVEGGGTTANSAALGSSANTNSSLSSNSGTSNSSISSASSAASNYTLPSSTPGSAINTATNAATSSAVAIAKNANEAMTQRGQTTFVMFLACIFTAIFGVLMV